MPRHGFVTVAAVAWSRLLTQRPDLVAEPCLTGWAARGWPLVLRRRLPTDPPGEWPLGVPLPPSLGKRRIALTMPADSILRIEPPPLLGAARHAAPAAWEQTIVALLGLDAETRCFGSLAWQHRTGLVYLSPASDLDLLWRLSPDTERQLVRVSAIAETAPMCIDGEVLCADGGVQWREILRGAACVAMKGEAAVALVPRARFLKGTA